MQLNTVVLPAPFGPMTAVMSPRLAMKLSVSTARRPPKRMVRSRTASSGAGVSASISFPSATPLRHEFGGDFAALPEGHGGRAAGDEAARPQHHHDHQGEAEDQHAEQRQLVGDRLEGLVLRDLAENGEAVA